MLGTTYTMASSEGTTLTGFGFHLGAALDVPVAPKMGVIVRAGYESKSFGATVSDGRNSIAVGTTINHFELGGSLRYDLSQQALLEGGLSLQIDAGGHSTALTRTAGGQTESSPIVSKHELANPTQIALTAGAGYRIPVAQGV